MIYLECYADEAFVKTLGIGSKEIKHAFNKGEVCNMLRKVTGSVGLVDEDPFSGKPSYERHMLGFKVFEDEKIILCEDKKTNNKLVIIRPTLEGFVIKIAKENEIDITQKYKRLSANRKGLHDDLTFKRNKQKFEDFSMLILELLVKDKTLLRLKNFIK
jgi:Txe/YoeB family toxin of Txe-Axe toxin-antitoxin module